MKLNMQTRACCRLDSCRSEGVVVDAVVLWLVLVSQHWKKLSKFVEKQSPIAPILLLPWRRVIAVVVQFSQENKSTLTYLLTFLQADLVFYSNFVTYKKIVAKLPNKKIRNFSQMNNLKSFLSKFFWSKRTQKKKKTISKKSLLNYKGFKKHTQSDNTGPNPNCPLKETKKKGGRTAKVIKKLWWDAILFYLF